MDWLLYEVSEAPFPRIIKVKSDDYLLGMLKRLLPWMRGWAGSVVPKPLDFKDHSKLKIFLICYVRNFSKANYHLL